MFIIEEFDINFQSSSRKKRLWTAFKVATRSKHVQRFRDSLNETKATLTLAMVHERYEKKDGASYSMLNLCSII
jgi:acyl-CoA reductase-like NAD-dependent aldehyde dehydrogenase